MNCLVVPLVIPALVTGERNLKYMYLIIQSLTFMHNEIILCAAALGTIESDLSKKIMTTTALLFLGTNLVRIWIEYQKAVVSHWLKYSRIILL